MDMVIVRGYVMLMKWISEYTTTCCFRYTMTIITIQYIITHVRASKVILIIYVFPTTGDGGMMFDETAHASVYPISNSFSKCSTEVHLNDKNKYPHTNQPPSRPPANQPTIFS